MNRGVLEEQKQREENHLQNQRALLVILPIVMAAVLVVGIFFGYKFYVNSVSEINPIAPSEAQESAADMNPMILRTVSSASTLEESYVPETTESCGAAVAVEVAAPLEEMVSAAKADGVELKVTRGYISAPELTERYNKEVQKYRKDSGASLVMAEAHVKKSFPPAGENELQTGLLVDITADTDGDFGKSSAFTWLTRHCVEYGFIQRYPDKENTGGISYSAHLFRYVGKEYAYEMRSLDMNFDEFVQYAQAH